MLHCNRRLCLQSTGIDLIPELPEPRHQLWKCVSAERVVAIPRVVLIGHALLIRRGPEVRVVPRVHQHNTLLPLRPGNKAVQLCEQRFVLLGD